LNRVQDLGLERRQRRNVNVEEGIVGRHKRAAAVKRFFDAPRWLRFDDKKAAPLWERLDLLRRSPASSAVAPCGGGLGFGSDPPAEAA
jgi:hypothetical protein